MIEVTPEFLADWPIPPVAERTDKEARGRVLVLGGGAQVPGAALLAGVAALRVGAGKLQIGAPAAHALPLGLAVPEARVFALPATEDGELASNGADEITRWTERCDAVVVGPGLVEERAAGALALRLIENAKVMVADAAAMPALAERPEAAHKLAGRLVLTPHAGEMAALSGCSREAIEAEPAKAVRALAARLQAVVALKGAVTLVASPEGQVWRHAGGSPGLATAGSGDVLAGIIAGLIARGASPAQAAVWGVWTHGACGRRLAARIAPVGFLARELLDEIAPVVAEREAAVARGA